MGEVWLFVVEILVLAGLVTVWLRLRAALAAVTATVSPLPFEPSDPFEPSEPSDGSGSASTASTAPVRLTGVLRRGRLLAAFVVLELDRDVLWVRSRPRRLGLATAVPRIDVAEVHLTESRRGRAPVATFEPVAGRAEGLEQFRLQLRGDGPAASRALRRLGWLAPPASSAGPRRGSDAKPRPGG